MNIVELEDQLHTVETRHDLLAPELDGWSAWPVLRMAVKLAMRGQLASPDQGRQLCLSPCRRMAIAFQDLLTLARRHTSTEFLTLSPSSSRERLQDGSVRDFYFDDLLTTFSRSVACKLEHINNPVFLPLSRQALRSSDVTTTAIHLAASLIKKAGCPHAIRSLASDFTDVIREEFPELVLSRGRIEDMLLTYHWRKLGYGVLLRRFRPRRLLLINAYNNHAIVAAAREQGIEVIELQHGVLGRHHAGYAWPTSAVRHKTKMPIPQRLWLYGDYWRDELCHSTFWEDEELRSIGSLRVDYYRRMKQCFDVQRQPRLVVTTQGVGDSLIDFLAEFVRIAKDRRMAFSMVVKLHPREKDASLYRSKLSGREVTILDNQQSPSTFELLAAASLHASVFSTCHFEALGLGVPTVILPLPWHEVVLPLHRAGYALLAQSPEALVDLVASRQEPVLESVSRKFFCPNALQNMRAELGMGSCC